MHKTLIAALAAAATLATVPAVAQEARGADVTRSEAQERAARAFERMDTNGDGKLDQADREARQRARFDRLDTDGNGAISYDEFSAQRERRAEMRGERRGEAGGPAFRSGGRGPMGHGMSAARGADSNGDGAITLDEFTAAALAAFDQMDANRDGTVTAEEREAARRSWREQRRSAPAS